MNERTKGVFNWLKRPQFSMRTFLILVTVVCIVLGTVGVIKIKAIFYRRAVSELAAHQIEVRPIRSLVKRSPWWVDFAQDWIDNDAFADDAVEVALKGPDLTERDVQSLSAFAEIRTLELVSPALTDATLKRLPALPPFLALSIRQGVYTAQGLAELDRLQRLTSLDLDGVPLDHAKLQAVAPALDVDSLALSLATSAVPKLPSSLPKRNYVSLFLKHVAFDPASPPGAGSYNIARPTPLEIDALPPAERLYLFGFTLSDGAISHLSRSKELKEVRLWSCDCDATLVLQSFQIRRKGPIPENERSLPLAMLHGVVTAKSELRPDGLAKLELMRSIDNLTIHKLAAPEEAPSVLMSMRVNTLTIPSTVPIVSLILMDRGKPPIIYVLPTEEEAEIILAKHPQLGRERLQFSVSHFLELRGLSFINALRHPTAQLQLCLYRLEKWCFGRSNRLQSQLRQNSPP